MCVIDVIVPVFPKTVHVKQPVSRYHVTNEGLNAVLGLILLLTFKVHDSASPC